jgi:hypothetical protein
MLRGHGWHENILNNSYAKLELHVYLPRHIFFEARKPVKFRLRSSFKHEPTAHTDQGWQILLVQQAKKRKYKPNDHKHNITIGLKLWPNIPYAYKIYWHFPFWVLQKYSQIGIFMHANICTIWQPRYVSVDSFKSAPVPQSSSCLNRDKDEGQSPLLMYIKQNSVPELAKSGQSHQGIGLDCKTPYPNKIGHI